MFFWDSERKLIYTYSGPKYCDANGAVDWRTSNKCPSYIGHIGRNFKPKLDLKPVIAFQRIPGKVGVYPLDFIKSLNNDGRYLLFISHAIQNGVVPQNLAVKQIGHVNGARYFNSKVLWNIIYWNYLALTMFEFGVCTLMQFHHSHPHFWL